MKVLSLISLIFSICLTTTFAMATEQSSGCDDSNRIYKVCTDQNQIIEKYYSTAQSENKLVLITFGADWCPWCKSLNRIFSESEVWSQLDGSVVNSEIGVNDISGKNVESGLKIITDLLSLNNKDSSTYNGLPFLAVVDPKTKKAAFIQTGDLEDNSNGEGHDRKKVIEAILKAVSEVKAQ